MSKNLLFLTLPAALALLAGCSKTDVIPAESAPQEITFQTLETKALSDFKETNKFYSYAYFLEKGKNWAAHSTDGQAYISNSLIEYDNTGKAWKNATTKYYWPKEGGLTFFAWSDNTDDPKIGTSGGTLSCAVGTGIAVAGYNITANKNKDLLVAEMKADQTANTESFTGSPSGSTWETGVPTIFKHVLSALVFTVNTDYETSNDPYTGVTFKLRSITLKNVSATGDYSQGSPTASAAPWSNWSNPQTLPAFSSTTGTEMLVTNATSTAQTVTPAAGDYHIVLPQTFATVTTITADTPVIEVVYTITTNYTGTAVTETVTATKSLYAIYTSWENGKRYTLNIILGLKEILWDPDVTPWTDVSGGDFNI